MKPMQGILIDPRTKEVRLVEAASAAAVKEMMGIRLWEVAAHDGANGELQLLVDEEGLFKEGDQPAFTYDGYPGVLIGCGLLMQVNEAGENVPVTAMTVEDVAARVEFTVMPNATREELLNTPPVITTYSTVHELLDAMSRRNRK